MFSFSGFSQDFKEISDPTSCKKKLENKSKETKTITASFQEMIYSSMYNNPKTGSGSLKYKKEGKIRWEKTEPQAEVILINGGSIRMQQDGKEISNAVNNRIAKKMQELMVQLISHDFLSKKDFTIAYYESDNGYKLILKPNSSRLSKYISKIELVFNKSTLALNSIAMYETEDDYVNYLFSSITFNATVADSNFTSF